MTVAAGKSMVPAITAGADRMVSAGPMTKPVLAPSGPARYRGATRRGTVTRDMPGATRDKAARSRGASGP